MQSQILNVTSDASVAADYLQQWHACIEMCQRQCPGPPIPNAMENLNYCTVGCKYDQCAKYSNGNFFSLPPYLSQLPSTNTLKWCLVTWLIRSNTLWYVSVLCRLTLTFWHFGQHGTDTRVRVCLSVGACRVNTWFVVFFI